jgi:hypothetical protein
VSVSTVDGTHVTYSTTMRGDSRAAVLRRGRYAMAADLDVVLLPREYTIDVGVHHGDGTTSDMVQRALDFTVLRVAESGSEHYPWPQTRGLVHAPASWHTEEGTASVRPGGVR